MSTSIVPGVSPENASIAVLDGQPVEVVNTEGVAELVRRSPLGIHAALNALRGSLTPAQLADVEAAL